MTIWKKSTALFLLVVCTFHFYPRQQRKSLAETASAVVQTRSASGSVGKILSRRQNPEVQIKTLQTPIQKSVETVDDDRRQQLEVSRAMDDMAAVEKRWRKFRDELYDNLLETDQEHYILQSLRDEREQFLKGFVKPDEKFALDLKSEDWDSIAKNGEWFDYKVQSLLGEERYARLIERRDNFNESLKNDPTRVIAITTDW